jgi:hypothetical protein
MTALETELFTLAIGALPYLGGLAVGALATWAIAKLRANRKTAALAEAVIAAQDVANAELKVIADDIKTPGKIPGDALKAAGAALAADRADLIAAAKEEIDVLANPTPAATADVGNASVNMPSPTSK